MADTRQTAAKILLAGSSALGILLSWAGLAYAQREEAAAQAAQTLQEHTAAREAQAVASLRYVSRAG